MKQFELVPSRLPEAIARLNAFAPFTDSSEFRDLSPHDLSLPSVVMGAFSRFLAEVEEQPVATETLGVLEELAGWQDLDVDNLIALDVVEVLDPELLNRLRSRWGPSMTRVFADSERRWMEAELDLDHDLD